jgi:hypothetical protein
VPLLLVPGAADGEPLLPGAAVSVPPAPGDADGPAEPGQAVAATPVPMNDFPNVMAGGGGGAVYAPARHWARPVRTGFCGWPRAGRRSLTTGGPVLP